MKNIIELILVSNIQPFSLNLISDIHQMLSLDFMRYAFFAGTMVSIVAGLVGYFIILRNLVFATEALGHVTFTGALAAAVIGLDPLIGLFGATTLVALLLGVLGTRVRENDVVVGTVLAWVLGLGALFLSIYTTQSSGANGTFGVKYLFGSLFGLQAQQAQQVGIIGLGIIVALLIIARPLLFASLDPDVALARGVPVRILSLIFLVLVALSLAEAVPAVGSLLNSALLITPAAIAQRLVTRPMVALVLSAVLALTFTWLGLTVGFYASYPVSFVISTLAFVTYVSVVTWQRLRASITPRLRNRTRLTNV
ncbi:MAG: metal ABC transporter permease [Rhizonema sp. NSF051]|nr:metal ABC transporter permease [Rhizonema sp. NSF051]